MRNQKLVPKVEILHRETSGSRRSSYKVTAFGKTRNQKILISGNEAIAEAAVQAGCRFYAGYPITPQNEIPAYMAKRMPGIGGVFIQSESELAAISMVMGASAAGARAMTSSSSPGISLKQEGISYIAGAELPAVIVNVMRAGPGLGNIWPAQSDYFQAVKGGGHGDYHNIVLAPSSAQEAFDLTMFAFDLADKYRNPVMILSDGMSGQMMEPIVIPEDRKNLLSGICCLTSEKKWAVTGCKDRLPNLVASFRMCLGDTEKLNQHLQGKYKQILADEQRCESVGIDEAEIIIVAYGIMARIAKGAIKTLKAKNIKVGLIRPITLWPFPETQITQILKHRLGRVKYFLVVEMSYGQMVEDVRLAVNGKAKVEFLGRAGGGVPTEEEIIKRLEVISDKL
ncbi:MAG: 3-methyl-2-oxobutanoate dehydrogenase subunit VorB [Candidatus Omnitrophota bacterium]|nr:3-methyl-2-oxobutanoate dehydrogenase subunit VorB [Candidatus Omnitrophota bacterium]